MILPNVMKMAPTNGVGATMVQITLRVTVREGSWKNSEDLLLDHIWSLVQRRIERPQPSRPARCLSHRCKDRGREEPPSTVLQGLYDVEGYTVDWCQYEGERRHKLLPKEIPKRETKMKQTFCVGK